jgi:Flp pilus assembly protein TadD
VLSGGDYKTASLSARRAYQINPKSAEAARVLAQISQRAGDGSELDWRRKVLELQPDSTEDALALVRAALRSNDLATAERTLHGISESGRQTAGYHAALGRLAEIKGDRAEAEEHWAKAAELAPRDAAYATQLALVQLGSSEAAKREGARAKLEQLRSDPAQRAAATRALIVDGASRPTDPQRLRTLANELQSYPEALFGDRLLYLEILRQLHDAGYPDYLADMKQRAAANAADVASLLTWMTTNVNAQEAVAFANGLPAETLAKWPVPLALADAYAKAGDWAGLHRHAGGGTWGGFEFLRHAYLARALRGEDDQITAEQEWAAAQKAASPQPQAILMLARTVAEWNWEKERIELLWAAAKERASRGEALQALYQHFAKNGDTAGVYRVLLRSIEAAPDDALVQNNFAQVSLLLDADPERARHLASELVRKDPSNAAYVSTYAFGLYSAGDIEGALHAFDSLKPEQLEAPSIAVYYGTILAAAGQKERAREYLTRGQRAFLLPEEKALLAKATSAAQ